MAEEKYFNNSAGEEFRYLESVPEGFRAGVLAVHGFAEHIGRYEHVEAMFAARGFSFYMMDNRGHGKSPGKRGHIARYDDYAEDIHEFRSVVESALGGRPLFMLGHSNGSLISARYALKYGAGVRGLVLSGIPIRMAVKVNPLKLKVGLLLAKIAPGLTLPGEIDPSDICRDKKVVEDYVNDPLVFQVNSIGFAAQFLWGMENLLMRASEFRLPVLFQHGGDDRLCDPASAREFFDNISSADKDFIMYTGLYHEVYNEFGKEDIIKTAIDWMEKRAG